MSARSYVRSVQAITFSVLALVLTAGTWLTAHHPRSVALNVGADVIQLLTCAFFFAAMTLPRRFLRRRITRREAELARLRSAFEAAAETVAATEAQAGAARRAHGPDSAIAVAAMERWQRAATDQRFTAIVHDDTVALIRSDQQWLTDSRAAATPGWMLRLRLRTEIRHLERNPTNPGSRREVRAPHGGPAV